MNEDAQKSPWRQVLISLVVLSFIVAGFEELLRALFGAGHWFSPIVMWLAAFCAFRESKNQGNDDHHVA